MVFDFHGGILWDGGGLGGVGGAVADSHIIDGPPISLELTVLCSTS